MTYIALQNVTVMPFSRNKSSCRNMQRYLPINNSTLTYIRLSACVCVCCSAFNVLK